MFTERHFDCIRAQMVRRTRFCTGSMLASGLFEGWEYNCSCFICHRNNSELKCENAYQIVVYKTNAFRCRFHWSIPTFFSRWIPEFDLSLLNVTPFPLNRALFNATLIDLLPLNEVYGTRSHIRIYTPRQTIHCTNIHSLDFLSLSLSCIFRKRFYCVQWAIVIYPVVLFTFLFEYRIIFQLSVFGFSFLVQD